MILRRGESVTEESTVHYLEVDIVLLRRGKFATEERTVCY